MATIKIDRHGAATITMRNGKVIPVPMGYESISTHSGANPELVAFPNDAEWWITGYSPESIDGLAAGLADGRMFRSEDGTCWTRYGDEMLVATPGQGITQPTRQQGSRRVALAAPRRAFLPFVQRVCGDWSNRRRLAGSV